METILIIEDDAAMLRGLKDNFEQQGYTVPSMQIAQRLYASFKFKEIEPY